MAIGDPDFSGDIGIPGGLGLPGADASIGIPGAGVSAGDLADVGGFSPGLPGVSGPTGPLPPGAGGNPLVPVAPLTPEQLLMNQFLNLFPEGSIAGSLDDYLGGVDRAGVDYKSDLSDIEKDWQNFLATHEAANTSVLQSFEDTQGQIGPEFDTIRNRLDTDLANIPQGGFVASKFGNLPVVAKQHSKVATDQAETRGRLSTDKFDTLRNFLTGRADTIYKGAGPQTTGLANLQNLIQNEYTTDIATSEAKLKPVDIATHLLDMQHSEKLAEIGKPDRPNLLERLIPAFGFAAGKIF